MRQSGIVTIITAGMMLVSLVSASAQPSSGLKVLADRLAKVVSTECGGGSDTACMQREAETSGAVVSRIRLRTNNYDEVAECLEAAQTMQDVAGRRMAWTLNCLDSSR